MFNDRELAHMNYIIYIPLALLPSIIWLLFYLRKDSHPESNKMIIKIFFYGMTAAIFAAAIEIAVAFGADFLTKFPSLSLSFFPFLSFILYHILVIGLIEETAKFLIVQKKVINDPEFDEPLDAMLYMIIVALGFAALENLLYLSPVLLPKTGLDIKDAAFVAGFRFIGATFLHALASGVIGYFLAFSILSHKNKKLLLASGITIAAVLHGLFNISIIGIVDGIEKGNTLLSSISTASLILILILLAIFVSFGFKKLKKIASICKIK